MTRSQLSGSGVKLCRSLKVAQQEGEDKATWIARPRGKEMPASPNSSGSGSVLFGAKRSQKFPSTVSVCSSGSSMSFPLTPSSATSGALSERRVSFMLEPRSDIEIRIVKKSSRKLDALRAKIRYVSLIVIQDVFFFFFFFFEKF